MYNFSKCKEDKPVSNFYVDKKKSLGHHSWCKNCFNKYMKLRRDALKRIVIEIKETSACINCGESDPAVLDFHHREPSSKDFAISALTKNNYNEERLMAELSKCIILCSNCHRKLHFYGELTELGKVPLC